MFFRKTGVDWLAVFLGNPGAQYARTRHNAGFMAAAEFSRRQGVAINRHRFRSLTAVCKLDGQGVLMMMPQTYMNLSGDAAAAAAGYYGIEPERILVVADDTALPPGALRIRRKGSAGGHNGLKSLIQRLGTEDFPRVKIGVGKPDNPEFILTEWVIGGMSESELRELLKASAAAAEAVECYITRGADTAMNLYNSGKQTN